MTENNTLPKKHDGGDTESRPLYKRLAIAAARLADDKKAEAVAVYDMDGRSTLADYVVVVTVDNPAQLDAVDDEISKNLKQEGLFALYRDGMRSKNWKVLDYGGIIVHIFERKAREFYAFDKVYAGYGEVKWEEKAAPAPKKPAPKKAKKPAAKKAPAKKTVSKKKTVKKAAVKRTAAKRPAQKKKTAKHKK